MKNERLSGRELKAIQRTILDERKNERAYKNWSNLDTLKFLIAAVIVALSVRSVVFEFIRVDGPSMQPTLYSEERMYVSKLDYVLKKPERGEIVIVRYPGYTESCVKRVIGLPGETIEVRDGATYINGTKLDETAYWKGYIREGCSAVKIPENTVFVMGDNRNDSKDSRTASVGPIPYSHILGRVDGLVWPLSRLAWFK